MNISWAHMKNRSFCVYMQADLPITPTDIKHAIIETTLAAKSRSINSCQNGAFADRYQVTVLGAHLSTKRRNRERVIESQPRHASLTLVIKIANGTREYHEYSLMSCYDSLFRSLPGYMHKVLSQC